MPATSYYDELMRDGDKQRRDGYDHPAIELYTKAFAAASDRLKRGRAAHMLGVAFVADWPQDACNWFELAARELRDEPKLLGDVYRDRAHAELARGDRAQAKRFFGIAVRLITGSNELGGMILLGDDARALLDGYVSKDPNFWAAIGFLGRIYLKEGGLHRAGLLLEIADQRLHELDNRYFELYNKMYLAVAYLLDPADFAGKAEETLLAIEGLIAEYGSAKHRARLERLRKYQNDPDEIERLYRADLLG